MNEENRHVITDLIGSQAEPPSSVSGTHQPVLVFQPPAERQTPKPAPPGPSRIPPECERIPTMEITEIEAPQIYRWVDEAGQVHYQDEPPNRTSFEEMASSGPQTLEYFKVSFLGSGSKALNKDQTDELKAELNKVHDQITSLLPREFWRKLILNIQILHHEDEFKAALKERGIRFHGQSGTYTSSTNEILVQTQGSPERTAALIQHEVTHAILAGITGYLPAWLNEGLAGYFEGVSVEGQSIRMGFKPEHHRYLTRRQITLSYDRLATLTYDNWGNDDSHASYAMAWSFVFYLMGRQEGRDAIAGLLQESAERYCEQLDSRELLKRHHVLDLKVLQRSWNEWLTDGSRHDHVR